MSDTSTSKTLVVILNYNGKEDTFHCIDSIREQTVKSDILIIDNASTDGLLEELPTKYPSIAMIRTNKNLGFAGGVNVGIRHALENKYQYVALINNDAIAKKDWLQNLLNASRHNGSSITTGLMLNEAGDVIDSAGEYYSIWGMSFPWFRGRKISEGIPQSKQVFGATGGGVLYKTKLFDEIGLFDEDFFLYFEDADINFRSQLSGHTSYYESSAVLYHKRGASSDKIPGLTIFHTFKNLPLVFWKNIPSKLIFKVGSRFFVLYLLFLANTLRSGKFVFALRGSVGSIYYFWKSTLWQRIKIQRSKKVSASYIWSILHHDLPPDQTGMRRFRKLFTGKD